MIIALDYDGTYSRDPMLWDRFIRDCKASGHLIILATMRYENGIEDVELKRIFEPMEVRLIFTGRKAKESFLADLGIFPKIWIDDNPSTVTQGLRR